MRIEKVLIENINSLAGRFEIDFLDPGYADGLFAIVGPSGAGKTTVLDAMALALYGRTPRIRSISKTSDEVMNKDAQMCRAEVCFRSKGIRYRASFLHKRAKGKEPFAQAVREVIEYDASGEGTPIASNITEADRVIKEITGLDYDQFTRSIMLAQFQFAEFLKADANARADILEQITDMDIYRTISMAVYARTKTEREARDAMKARMDAIVVLDDERQKTLENQLGRIDSDIAAHTALHERLTACGRLIETIGIAAQALTEHRRQKPQAEMALKTAMAQFAQAREAETAEKKALADLLGTLKMVRALDSDVAACDKDIARLGKEADADTAAIKKHKSAILELFRKYMPDADGERLKELYDAQNVADSIRGDAQAALDAAKKTQTDVQNQIDTALQHRDAAYWQKRIDVLEILQHMAEAEAAKARADKEIDALKAGQTDLMMREQAAKTKLAALDEQVIHARLEERFFTQRQSLEDGQPCPLCGAVHHPFEHRPYSAQALAQAQTQKDEAERQHKQLLKELSDAGSHIARWSDAAAESARAIQAGRKALAAKSASADGAGIDTRANDAAECIRQALDEAKAATRAHTAGLEKLNACSKSVADMTARLGDVDRDVASIDSAKQRIKEIEQNIAARRGQIDAVTTQRNEAAARRQTLFGSKDADAEEAAAQKSLEAVQKTVETCREDMDKAKTRADRIAQDETRTQQAIDTDTKALTAAYADAVRMAADVCRDADEMDMDIATAAGGICAAAARFGDNAMDSADALRGAAAAALTLLDKEKVAKGAIGEMLRENERRLGERKKLADSARTQERTVRKWERLNALIGSAEGDKFSRMAQGITFEVLLQYANVSLSRMTDRYILVRDMAHSDKPLEISVIDTYQAGEMRPVSNLSGGESFVVSMALALGLSEMSSSKTRIDSLFIDEGFASLDEVYLEAAMQTLSSLGNRDGKLVGVISHVDAIKERIAAKIEVMPLSGGNSTLTGPGVRVFAE